MRNDVVPCLGSSLCIDGATDIAEVVKQVESIELTNEIAVQETTGETGIPNKFVGVHFGVGITTTGVHGEVGGKLEMKGQFEGGQDAIVKVGDVDGGEISASAGGVLGVDVGFDTEVDSGGRTIVETEGVVPVKGGYSGFLKEKEVNAVMMVNPCFFVEGQFLLTVKRLGDACTEVGIPIAIDVFRRDGANACAFVVDGTHCNGILLQTEVGISMEDGGRETMLAFLRIKTEMVTIFGTPFVNVLILQMRIAMGDVERIAVIADVEKLGHGRRGRFQFIVGFQFPISFLLLKLVGEPRREQYIVVMKKCVELGSLIMQSIPFNLEW